MIDTNVVSLTLVSDLRHRFSILDTSVRLWTVVSDTRHYCRILDSSALLGPNTVKRD